MSMHVKTDLFSNDRYNKLNFILEKMDGIVRNSNMAFNQKRIHRESKATSTIDKIFELNLIKPEDAATVYTDIYDNEQLILPQTEEEYNELISYLTNDLNSSTLQNYESSSDEGSDSNNKEIKKLNFKKSKRSKKQVQKQVLNKENFRKYFFDIEYKIKMEIKKIEMEKEVKSRGDSLVNTEDCKLSCFSTSRGASSKRHIGAIGNKTLFHFDNIKSFFVEDSKVPDKKRYSCMTHIPEMQQLSIENSIPESGQNSEDEDANYISTQVCFFKTEKNSTSCDDGKRRNTLIGSCLFD